MIETGKLRKHLWKRRQIEFPISLFDSPCEPRFKNSPQCMQNIVQNYFNPLTPGAFCEKGVSWTFWWFLGWISVKLPLIWSKMHLHHDGLAFSPLALRFATFWLMHAHKSKFWGSFWTRKWPTSLGFSIFGIFLASPFFLFLFFLLQWLTFY